MFGSANHIQFSIVFLCDIKNDKLWQIFAVDSQLYNIWKWVDSHLHDNRMSVYSKNSSITSKEDLFNSHNPENMLGIRAILFQNGVQIANRSETMTIVNNDWISSNAEIVFIRKYFKSTDR